MLVLQFLLLESSFLSFPGDKRYKLLLSLQTVDIGCYFAVAAVRHSLTKHAENSRMSESKKWSKQASVEGVCFEAAAVYLRLDLISHVVD